jgi:hypothetical protein
MSLIQLPASSSGRQLGQARSYGLFGATDRLPASGAGEGEIPLWERGKEQTAYVVGAASEATLNAALGTASPWTRVERKAASEGARRRNVRLRESRPVRPKPAREALRFQEHLAFQIFSFAPGRPIPARPRFQIWLMIRDCRRVGLADLLRRHVPYPRGEVEIARHREALLRRTKRAKPGRVVSRDPRGAPRVDDDRNAVVIHAASSGRSAVSRPASRCTAPRRRARKQEALAAWRHCPRR